MEESYSVIETAKALRTTRQQVYRLIKSGKLKAYSIGMGNIRKNWRVSKEDLETFIGK